ncbi:hypothetical protein MR626_01750 [bacterium]|nr:hypothetical protein [bacterium]MDY4581632.1 hypothetical protein [Candidatus Faecousia sp.]
MPKVTVPDEREKKIIRENQMDPDHYGVTYRDKDTIRLLCYETRDEVVIQKGDRPW